MKKYKLTENKKHINGKTVYQIEALKDFADVKKGDLGGYVESEKNLSQEGNCSIYKEAAVFDNARVLNHARIYHNALIYGDAIISDHAVVTSNACVYDNAYVSDFAYISGRAKVYGFAKVRGQSNITGYSLCEGVVEGRSTVTDDAVIDGSVIVLDADIIGDAIINSMSDYFVIYNNFSSGRRSTWTKSNKKFKVGCFYGNGEELIAKAYKDSKEKGDKYKMIVEFVEKINF